MSDEYQDPSGNTQAFRAFAQRDEPAPPAARSNLPLIIGGGVAVLVILLVVVLLLIG
jgi:hypothetical protein